MQNSEPTKHIIMNGLYFPKIIYPKLILTALLLPVIITNSQNKFDD